MTGSPRIGRDIAAGGTHSRLGACVLALRGHRQLYLRTAAAIASGVLAFPATGNAADLPLKAPALKAVYDWTGLYIGAHAGYSLGSSRFALNDGTGINDSGVFSGMIGGVQAGYNYRLNSGWLVGAEGDFSFPNYITSNSIVSFLATPANTVAQQWDYTASLRGRLGYTSGPWLVYATGGFAWMGERYFDTPAAGDVPKILNTRPGWIAGAGIEYGFAPHWSARVEYLYSRFDSANVAFSTGAQYTSSSLDFQSIRLGLNRKVDWPGMPSYNPKSSAISSLIATESDRWEIHGQSTYLPQGYPSFPALYTGPNSLSPSAQAKATWSNSLFLNARLWDGGEVYYNPELLQGFGLNDTVGAAGFPNGEAQKSNFAYPHYNTSRLFVRQTFGFGGEQEELASGQLQLGQKVDVSRLTVQAGKFAVIDVFDGNAYAKDTRKDFMNWSLWAPGAFDYSADKVGLTYGVTAEFNPEAMGAARRLFPDGGGAQFKSFRYQGRGARPVRGRDRDALLAVRPIGQAQDHGLARQRQYGQLPRNAGQSRAQSRHRPDPARPHQGRLRRQSRTGDHGRCRAVRPLELE
ncbi:opacity protein-like surface antigen [Bradyrhizobium sp. LM4.3]